MGLKKTDAERAKRVLGDSGLAEMIIASAEKGGFELRYSRMPPGVIASNATHAQSASRRTPEDPRYYDFLYEALYVPISLVDDGRTKYRIELLPKKFRMDPNAVTLFVEGWDIFSKGGYV